jgi:hypothetical protein
MQQQVVWQLQQRLKCAEAAAAAKLRLETLL